MNLLSHSHLNRIKLNAKGIILGLCLFLMEIFTKKKRKNLWNNKYLFVYIRVDYPYFC